MASTYSSFFASGLLAPPVTIYSSKDYRVSFEDDDMGEAFPKRGGPGLGLSPAAPSSPMAMPDDSDIEAEMDSAYDRATTPTPDSRLHSTCDGLILSNGGSINQQMLSRTGASEGRNTTSVAHPTYNQNQQAPAAGAPRSSPSSQAPNGRRLRRRRSSLAGAQSPMSVIKSPSRSAGHALELQRHLLTSPLRSRSNSTVSLAAAATGVMLGHAPPLVGNEGCSLPEQQNRFMQRLRSGSTSSFGSLRRKPLRRASMQPPAPPPTAPLPALPPSLADTPNCGFLEPPLRSAPPTLTRTPLAYKPVLSQNLDSDESMAPGMYRKNRDRSYSINAYDRIDEEMKEN